MSRKTIYTLTTLLTTLTLATLACGLGTRIENQAPTQKYEPLPEVEYPVEEEYVSPKEEYVSPKTEGDDASAGVVREAEELSEAPAVSMPSPTSMPPITQPNDESYPDMFFENYGINPFIDTEDDHYSTFALDVDTGSYSLARSYLNRGVITDKDAIRVEEFVNYFKQGYSYPSERETFTIHLDGGPAPFTENNRYQMLRVGVQGYAVDPEDRKDVSLTFVIDVSGSMNMENRLELVKRALELLVEQLGPRDQVSIVVYGSTAHTILEPTRGSEYGTIMEAIRALQPEGSTNAEAGLRVGYEQALRAFNPHGINRVILCSDGVANVGNTGAESIWEQISAYASEGITLTTIGFGMGNYNDVLMEQLADNGDGFYAYVDTLKEAENLFVENLTSTLQAIAMDAKIQVEFNPEVVARYRLVGFENRAIADESFRDDRVDAGEIGAGHSVTALYEIKLQEGAQGRIASVFLRWENPDTHRVEEINQNITVDNLADSFHKASPYFQWAVIVAEFAEILRESYWAQDSSLADILEEAQWVSWYLDENSDTHEFIEMVRQAQMLVEY
ncbi:MAG: von Willebrand factor type A domain-containing protein [Anaerolineales bacterium]|nr:von Willebrand factor type A domain-containing protein [Anaerolineales bacterium]